MINFQPSAENWGIIWQYSFNASISPIDRVFSETLSNSPLIAVALSIANQFWNKRAVAYFNQHVETGLVGSGSALAKRKTIYEGELLLFPLEIIGNSRFSFDLFLKVAATGELIVYEYTGEIN